MAGESEFKTGDKFNNRHVIKHQTRLYRDRTFGGNVVYWYDSKKGYEAQCTDAEWREYVKRAKKIRSAKT